MTLNKTTAGLQCFLHGRGESLVKLKFYTRGLIGEGRNREGHLEANGAYQGEGLLERGLVGGLVWRLVRKGLKTLKNIFQGKQNSAYSGLIREAVV